MQAKRMWLLWIAGDWVYLKLPVPIVLTAVEFYVTDPFGLVSRGPGLFKLYGSKDGLTWVVLHAQTSTVPVYTNFSTRITVKPAATNYAYIGLVVNKLRDLTINSYVLQMTEWKIFGSICVQVCTLLWVHSFRAYAVVCISYNIQ